MGLLYLTSDMTPSDLVGVYRLYRGTCCIYRLGISVFSTLSKSPKIFFYVSSKSQQWKPLQIKTKQAVGSAWRTLQFCQLSEKFLRDISKDI
jgi:hypothetical protein